MLFYSCGTCGWSILSQNLPCLELWTCLLVPAFGLYYWQNAKLDYEGLSVFQGLILVMIGTVASAAMFAGILFPAAFGYAIVLNLYRAIRVQHLSIRISSLALLACFGITAVWGIYERQRLGAEYALTRFQAGGPGYSFFSRTAKDPGLDVKRYVELLGNGTNRQAGNVESILLIRASKLDLSVLEKELLLIKSGLGSCPEPRKAQLQKIIQAYSDEKTNRLKSPTP